MLATSQNVLQLEIIGFKCLSGVGEVADNWVWLMLIAMSQDGILCNEFRFKMRVEKVAGNARQALPRPPPLTPRCYRNGTPISPGSRTPPCRAGPVSSISATRRTPHPRIETAPT
jgi:hypothetical protein